MQKEIAEGAWVEGRLGGLTGGIIEGMKRKRRGALPARSFVSLPSAENIYTGISCRIVSVGPRLKERPRCLSFTQNRRTLRFLETKLRNEQKRTQVCV